MNSKIRIGNATPIKILTVAVNDSGAKSVLKNKNRIDLLDDIAKTIKNNENFRNADLICFPGCYFFMNDFVGNLPFEDRKRVIEAQSFFACIQRFCKNFPNAKVIIGIDSRVLFKNNDDVYYEVNGKDIQILRKSKDLFIGADTLSFKEKGDELCVAFDISGVIGVGRKVFPVTYWSKQFIPYVADPEESYLYEINNNKHYLQKHTFVSYYNDFDDEKRIIEVKGRKVLLCACYDMFGVMLEFEEDFKQSASSRRSAIGAIFKENKLYLRDDKGRYFNELKDKALNRWKALLHTHKPTIAVSTIHSFNYANDPNFWMRHGIATASAALGAIANTPCLAIGASHFVWELPSENSSNLCSFNIPKKHIGKGQNRPLLDRKPQHFIEGVGKEWKIGFTIKGFEV